MPWVKRLLRGTTIYVRADQAGRPITGADGRVDVIYKATADAKIYRAAAANLASSPALEREAPLDDGDLGGERAEAATAKSVRKAAPTATAPAEAVIIYTDGACTGNPGPMGIGVVMLADGVRSELAEYLGHGTNNIAELVAIERGLELALKLGDHARKRPIWVHSDSAYALGLLGKGWKAKANVELVARLRTLAARFAHLEYIKVAGHAGVPENERCDELARQAVAKGRR